MRTASPSSCSKSSRPRTPGWTCATLLPLRPRGLRSQGKSACRCRTRLLPRTRPRLRRRRPRSRECKRAEARLPRVRRNTAFFSSARPQRSFETRPGALIDDMLRRSSTTRNTRACFTQPQGTPHVIGQISQTLIARQRSVHLTFWKLATRKFNRQQHTTNHVFSFTRLLVGQPRLATSEMSVGFMSLSLQLNWLSRLFRCVVWRSMASHCNSATEHLVEVERPTQSLSRDDARVPERMGEVAKIHLQGCDASPSGQRSQTPLAILCCRRHSDPGFGQEW